MLLFVGVIVVWCSLCSFVDVGYGLLFVVAVFVVVVCRWYSFIVVVCGLSLFFVVCRCVSFS